MKNKTSSSIKVFVLLILLAICIVSFFISIGKGSLDISFQEVIKAIFIEDDTVNHRIIFNVRLPRTLVAGLVGICLGVSGAILQGVMRNPLAAPNIIGVSSGAGLMAYIILILFPKYYYLVPIGAFVGALFATLLIYLLAWKNGVNPMRLILAGVAVSSLLGAGISSLMTLFPDKVAGAVGFMVGGLSARTWPDFNILWPYALLGLVLTFLFPKKLNILMLGDEIATGLGLNVERTRLMFIAFAALLAASAVSVVGLLGFVGLIVPHTARLIIGSDYRYLFPATAILGATVVMLCDTIARLVFDPVEIPVGIVMSLLGAPFFLFLLRERKSMER
ncbi:iron ABC transporter permease [Alkaliphilus pronyensis]|uniref:Iron ABC transporter permease n=2 Tax=Alkaliphilus pronyensis TaxID=1482732 RepID=A0A6I0FK23_9FIRM|nr:iron ABC transporter permease [Alkaliphilus pronyensis]